MWKCLWIQNVSVWTTTVMLILLLKIIQPMYETAVEVRVLLIGWAVMCRWCVSRSAVCRASCSTPPLTPCCGGCSTPGRGSLKQGCGPVFVWYGSGFSILGWIPIQIQGFDDQIFLFWIKNTIYLSLGHHKGRPSLLKPSALKREHPTLQNMKFLKIFYFCGSFFPSWIRIPNTDPDPLTWLNPDPIGIRIRKYGRPRSKSCQLRTLRIPHVNGTLHLAFY